MKSMTDLWRELANELAGWCHTSTTQDYNKLLSRVENEGLSFLTITLPSFGKDFENCLEQGLVDDCHFRGFKRSGGLPLFLGGFLRQIFDVSSGVILPQPSIDSIYAVRQLTAVFAKILVPCSEDRVRDAFVGYVKIEEDLLAWEEGNTFDVSNFERVSRLLFSDVFAKMDELVYNSELVPRHGPGSTADRMSGNQKYDLKLWSERLESLFPFGDYAIPNWRYNNQYHDVEILDPDAEWPVKVIHVPKTLKTPRIIAMEPAYMQYMQQAVLHPLVQHLEAKVVEGNTRDNLGSYFVGFTDQIPNREMACRGSKDGSLATLDLSEASDRVHILHVEAMLQRFPHFYEAVQATRSTKAEVPTIGVHLGSLRKFASMGSALCFPIEAMVFTTAVFLGIEASLKTPLTRKIVRSYVGKVRIYGDDIIIPVECVTDVIETLSRLGFRVNFNKSFWNGKFRESCGGDYYASEDVTPVRVRNLFPSSRHDAEGVQSLVALRNLLYLRGLWRTTRWLDEQIVGKLLPHFPIVEPTAPCIGRTSFLRYKAEKICDATHAPRVRAYVAKPRIPASEASGIGSLLKCILPTRVNPFEDKKHLSHAGRPSAVDIKLRWSSPF